MISRTLMHRVAEKNEGFGRDEGQYMRAGERYWGWFEELADNIKHHALKRSFIPTPRAESYAARTSGRSR